MNISASLFIKIEQFRRLNGAEGVEVGIRQRIGKAKGSLQNYDPRGGAENTAQERRLPEIYQACVISALLHGSKCWRVTLYDLKKLQSFHTPCPRKIMHIF